MGEGGALCPARLHARTAFRARGCTVRARDGAAGHGHGRCQAQSHSVGEGGGKGGGAPGGPSKGAPRGVGRVPRWRAGAQHKKQRRADIPPHPRRPNPPSHAASGGPALRALHARAQVPDVEKRRRADFVVDTGAALEETRAAVQVGGAAMRVDARARVYVRARVLVCVCFCAFVLGVGGGEGCAPCGAGLAQGKGMTGVGAPVCRAHAHPWASWSTRALRWRRPGRPSWCGARVRLPHAR
jgi:hypothetical protein